MDNSSSINMQRNELFQTFPAGILWNKTFVHISVCPYVIGVMDSGFWAFAKAAILTFINCGDE